MKKQKDTRKKTDLCFKIFKSTKNNEERSRKANNFKNFPKSRLSLSFTVVVFWVQAGIRDIVRKAAAVCTQPIVLLDPISIPWYLSHRELSFLNPEKKS